MVVATWLQPPSTEGADAPVRFTRAGLVAGALETAPVTLFVVTFGAVFCAAAVGKGLSVELTGNDNQMLKCDLLKTIEAVE